MIHQELFCKVRLRPLYARGLQGNFGSNALLMRKPETSEFTVRLSSDSEEQRMRWVGSDKHQSAWPALATDSEKTDDDGFRSCIRSERSPSTA